MTRDELKREIIRMYEQLPEDLQDEVYRKIQEMIIHDINQNGVEVPLEGPSNDQ